MSEREREAERGRGRERDEEVKEERVSEREGGREGERREEGGREREEVKSQGRREEGEYDLRRVRRVRDANHEGGTGPAKGASCIEIGRGLEDIKLLLSDTHHLTLKWNLPCIQLNNLSTTTTINTLSTARVI